MRINRGAGGGEGPYIKVMGEKPQENLVLGACLQINLFFPLKEVAKEKQKNVSPFALATGQRGSFIRKGAMSSWYFKKS